MARNSSIPITKLFREDGLAHIPLIPPNEKINCRYYYQSEVDGVPQSMGFEVEMKFVLELERKAYDIVQLGFAEGLTRNELVRTFKSDLEALIDKYNMRASIGRILPADTFGETDPLLWATAVLALIHLKAIPNDTNNGCVYGYGKDGTWMAFDGAFSEFGVGTTERRKSRKKKKRRRRKRRRNRHDRGW